MAMTVTVTLTDRVSKLVEALVDGGLFPDAQAAVEAAVTEMVDNQLDIDAWMAEVVLPTLALNRADPSRSLSREETFTRLRQNIAEAIKAHAA
jgi:Arc/MetJ-type ribon-helix-helix transcriptional regulator